MAIGLLGIGYGFNAPKILKKLKNFSGKSHGGHGAGRTHGQPTSHEVTAVTR
jgi:hypothetical protein